ncbi:MAG TPA: alpha/beta hydrolase [Chloroflexota bacterium]|nr:alpha/beta hydrolase [Chloroflexota bacterium]
MSDPRVEAAVAHWAPRFIANGIDYNDLQTTLARIELPLLVVFGKQDRLIPYRQAERLFAEARSADKQLAIYPDGNYACNNVPYVYRPLVADWVAARLAAGRALS